jgi:hypothetical protein
VDRTGRVGKGVAEEVTEVVGVDRMGKKCVRVGGVMGGRGKGTGKSYGGKGKGNGGMGGLRKREGTKRFMGRGKGDGRGCGRVGKGDGM